MAEENADDEALFDVWRRLTPEQVDAIHDVVARLARVRGRPSARDVAEAGELRDGPLGLGFLPAVQRILDNA